MPTREITILLSPGTFLTKTYYSDGTSEAYPFAAKFTSHEVSYETLAELKDALVESGHAGACLLKGKLSRRIENEPRRGLNIPNAPTDLLVLDYDAKDGFESPDALLAALDPALADVSYIFQHSASAGIKHDPGIRGHYFIMLDRPVSPSLIKQWFLKLNFTVPELRDRIKLSTHGLSLCYPLDVTVGQNDKLIYLADPKCLGFDGPELDRFTLVEREHQTYTLAPMFTMEQNQQMKTAILEELQRKEGIEPHKPKYSQMYGMQVVANPPPCAVTSHKREGNFIRLNLNGGDSWAYWCWADNPEILYSFKDEDPVLLSEIAPEFYRELTKVGSGEITPFCFHHRPSSTYYTGVYETATLKLLELYTAKRERVKGFMEQYGHNVPSPIQDWDLVFDPSEAKQIDLAKRWVNSYTPTKYVTCDHEVSRVPPIIEKTLRHICVDDETYNHFVNWLAFIFKYRRKTGTAWIFSGTFGTGKGTLYNQVIRPLIGGQYCTVISNDTLADRYNGYLENNIILWLDEGNVEAMKDMAKIIEKTKTLITEPTLPIHKKFSNEYNAPNFSNLIFAANAMVPHRISRGDRRFNVAPRQETPIRYRPGEWEQIENELADFAAYLNHYEVSEVRAMTPLHNAAKEELLELSQTTTEDMFLNLRKGNLEYFLDGIDSDPSAVLKDGFLAYKRAVIRWYETTKDDKVVRVYVQELREVYKWLTGSKINPKSFGWLCRKHGLQTSDSVARFEGSVSRYFDMRFHPPSEVYECFLESTGAQIIPFKKEQAK